MSSGQQRTATVIRPADGSTQAVKDSICAETIRVCQQRWSAGLQALVLSGSLARDEATFVKDGELHLLLGDVDFFWVFRDSAPLPSPAAAASAAREIEGILRSRGVVIHVGFACVHAAYFSRLPKHISPYEIRESGQVVWGDHEILALIPAFSTDQISREDAWRLLANRIVEQLEVLAGTSELEHYPPGDVRYRTVKLFLDMATSYLLFAGRYHPSYRGRQLALESLAQDSSAQASAPFPLKPFSDRISDCTRFKLTGEITQISHERLLTDSVRYARLLWRWELEHLTGQKHPLSNWDLMLRWMARQPVKARIRGWASLLRRCEWRRSWQEWPRWIRLARVGSPRYWVYTVATELFFLGERGVEATSAPDWKCLVSCLPFPGKSPLPAGAFGWQAAARSTVDSYRRFLETTVA